MFRFFPAPAFFLLFCVALSGCGALMARTITTETETIGQRKPGQIEPWDKTFVAQGTGVFDDKRLTAEVAIQLARTDLCRRYTLTEVVIESTEGRALGKPGLALDAGVLASGILGSLFLSTTPAKSGVILGASIPLIVDGVTVLADRPSTTRSEFRKEVEVTAETDAKGIFACSVMTESWAEIRFGNQATHAVDGVYRFHLDEQQLMAMGNTESVTLPLFITPKHVAQTLRNTVEHTLVVKLGPDFSSYAMARDETRKYGTLLRMAQFIERYPASQLNEGLRSAFLLLLPSAANTDELQTIAGLPDVDPELRQAVHRRFTQLRVEKLIAGVLENLLAALRANREEGTFARNGFTEQGRESARQKGQFVATMCRLRNELAERDVKSIGERNREWSDELAPTIAPAELILATRWLQSCTASPSALP